MIQDKEHSELRNLMTPLVNYFYTMERMHELPSGKVMQVYELLSKEHKIIFETLPRIREILNEESGSEEKFCFTCRKRKKSKGDGTLELLCEC